MIKAIGLQTVIPERHVSEAALSTWKDDFSSYPSDAQPWVFIAPPGTPAALMIVPVRHQACIPYTQPELSPNASLLSLPCGLHCPFHFPRASETAFAPCPHHTVALYRYWHSLAISHKPLFSLPVPISESLPKGRICSTRTVAQPAIPVPVTCVSSRCTCFVMSRRFSSFF